MIFYTVIYVTLINLTEKGMYSSTVTKEISISLFMSLKIFNYGQIKIIFCRDKNFCKQTFWLLLLPLWESKIVLCFVVRYFMSILVLQLS